MRKSTGSRASSQSMVSLAKSTDFHSCGRFQETFQSPNNMLVQHATHDLHLGRAWSAPAMKLDSRPQCMCTMPMHTLAVYQH